MRGNIKYKILLAFIIVSIISFACGGAYYLGRLYIGIITDGYTPQNTRVDSEKTRTVSAQDEQKILMLNPVPVFFLQAGVYSDLAGAEKAAKPLTALGYKPYITHSAPFKLWLGLYKERAYTDEIKLKLMDKGISTFTGSIVVNGNNLKYSETNENLIKDISPVLQQYTVWLKENLNIFRSPDAAGLDIKTLDREVTVIDKVYTGITSHNPVHFNNQILNDGFSKLETNVSEYKVLLHEFQKQKSQEKYSILQRKLLEFIDDYVVIVQKIENISKT